MRMTTHVELVSWPHQIDPARPDTALFVGWVADADILLSRADRLAYVVECGYLPASPAGTTP